MDAAPPTPAARTVAAFDFDGTLTRRDTLVPFLVSVAGWSRVGAATAADAPRLAGLAIGRGDRDEVKERFLVRVLGGISHDDVAAAGRAYAARLVPAAIRPDMHERLAWHRAEGHEIVIVSASLDVYIDEVARLLAVDAAMSTRLEVDDNGRCTGRMLDGNCRGPNKVVRLREYLGGEPATLWAYGDSEGDREMLAIADHPVRIRRARFRPRV